MNCSFIILSSRSWPGSNRRFIWQFLSKLTSNFSIFLNSIKSASALTGLLLGSKDNKVMFTLLFNNAPLHLLGLYGLMGVNARTLAPTGITGPLRDKLYAELPAGVEIKQPSPKNSSILVLLLTWTLIFAMHIPSYRSRDSNCPPSTTELCSRGGTFRVPRPV